MYHRFLQIDANEWDTESSMISEELLSGSIQEFFEYSVRQPEQIRHREYEIYNWTKNSSIAGSHTVTIPSWSGQTEFPPDDLPQVSSLIESLITDDDILLIQTKRGAIKAFNRIVEEIRIEANRGDTEDLKNEREFWNALHTDEGRSEYIAPIVGLSFNKRVQITDNLVIRRLSEFEKELMLNKEAIGGGSVALHIALKTGNLTHAAVYEYNRTIEDGWEGGMGIMTEAGQEVQEALKNLKIALRLVHQERFQMSVWYNVDRTFYPSIFSAHEMHGPVAASGIEEPKLVSNAGKIAEYYERVSGVNEDEGLRVAINRLESSYRKVSNADGVVDAVIGIEALLSPGRSGSFREVRRRAAILSGEKARYSELGGLQSLRNATVHGQETQVDREELEKARNLLATLINRVITIIIEDDIGRTDVIDTLDAAITNTVEKQFNELLSEFESM